MTDTRMTDAEIAAARAVFERLAALYSGAAQAEVDAVFAELQRSRAAEPSSGAPGRPGDNWLTDQARGIAAEQSLLPPWKRVPALDAAAPELCPACDAGEPELCAVSTDTACVWERAVYDRGFAAGSALLAEVAALRDRLRKSARELQAEVDHGIAIRQSAESKLARVQVLRSCADSIDRICGAPETGAEKEGE